MVPYLRAANVDDGSLDLSDVKSMNFNPDEQRLFALRPGDVLVTEGSGSLTAVGASAVWSGELSGTVCFQNTLLRLRPRSEATDPRFLAWWARSAFVSGMFASIATGANILHLSAERVRSMPAVFPDPLSQRRIADFLDHETQRIDQLIAWKQQMMELVEERFSAWLDFQVWKRISYARVPLMHLTDPRRPIMYGIVLPGPDVNDGVTIVKGGDVARSGLRRDGLCRTTFDIESRHARSRLDPGDLLFAIRGGIGDVAEVPQEIAGSNITQDVARISPRSAIDRRWLLHALRTRTLQDLAAERITGATVRGLNIWDLKRLPVPVPGKAEQEALAKRFDEESTRAARVAQLLAHQVALLQERRQVLITAAVSGLLDIPEVAA
jgi:type I restriction enzyme, S subunit